MREREKQNSKIRILKGEREWKWKSKVKKQGQRKCKRQKQERYRADWIYKKKKQWKKDSLCSKSELTLLTICNSSALWASNCHYCLFSCY